jgi:uncharacterized integral membrane protein
LNDETVRALFVYTVVASIVFTVSYFRTRNARRAAFHAGIGIAAFTALAYLGGISEHSINKHLTAIDVSIVFLAVVACLVLKFTLSGKPSSEPMMWWQTLLIASLLFYFPAFVGGAFGDFTFAAARKFGWPAVRVALVAAVVGAVATVWLYGRRQLKHRRQDQGS